MTVSRPFGLLRFLPLQPQRAIGLLAIVVGLVLCALVANNVYQDYEQQFAATRAKTGSLTQLLEEHTRQSMRRVELSLFMAAQEVQTLAGAGGRVSAATGTRLRAFLPQDGLIASFGVLDSEGLIVASTLTENLADLPRAVDRAFFLAQQNPVQSGLFIGAAMKSRISGRWIIPVITKLGGGLDGYLFGTVDPAYFQHLYQSIDTGSNGAVTLFTKGGWAVARWPFSAEVAQHNWLASPLFSQHVSVSSSASVDERDAMDNTPRIYSYRVLQDYPLVVSLAVSLDETLIPWRRRTLLSCAGLLLALVFLGGAAAMLIAQQRRRLRAESALKLSEISVLMSSVPTFWVGQDARILRVNQAACDLHGYAPEQMLGMTIPDLNPDMSMRNWPGHWARLRSAGSMHFEARHRNAQGLDLPVEIDVNFIVFEGQEYNYAVMRDLTLRKQAEAEIQRAAATLRGAIDAVDDAFVLFDKDDRLVYCNARYLQLYPGMQDVLRPGARFEDLVRVGAQRRLYRESAGQEDAWIAGRLRAHREGKGTRIQKRDDGRVLRVIDRRTPDGHTVGIRVDITEMVRATEAAQQASRYKSQFLANMSHEIRTPMNAVLGLLALLQNTELRPVQRDYAAKAEGAAQSLLGLLNDIMDFSKVEAGKLDLDPQPFRLDRLLDDVAVILSSTLDRKAIEVVFDIDAALPAWVVGDSLRLRQVLLNLGGNAIKFTSQGQVVVRVRQCALRGQEALIEFSLQDTGIGIAPEKQAHIFSGFSQAEASTTRRFGGSGLGLAICKRLVELMGGTLALQSTPGEGSCFSFVLPLPVAATPAQDAADVALLAPAPQRTLVADANPVAQDVLCGTTHALPPPGARNSKRPLEGMRILVVEDNPINQQVAQELLHVEGAAVSLAANGQLGVEAVAASRPPFDVVLMDIQMPVLDGYDATRKIRQGLGLADLPIVAMTANAMASDRQACLAAGMNEHVGKPFNRRDLVALLRRVTGRESARRQEPVLADQALPVAAAKGGPAFLSPYLDTAVAVERLSGLTSLYLEVARDYVGLLDQVEPAFRHAAVEGKLEALMAQAHSLKGISATVGAQMLSDHAARLEKLFRAPPADLVPLEQLPALLELVAATRAATREAVQMLSSAAPEIDTVPARAS